MENQPSSKTNNLAAKLKVCREKATPRLKQQELADLLTSKGVAVKRTTVTNWETGYAEPSEEALMVYARLRGDNYWWWLLYFLDEDAKPGDTVDYNNLGQKTLQITDRNKADVNGIEEAWEIDQLADKEASTPPKNGPLAQALRLKASDAVEAIKRMLSVPHPNKKTQKLLNFNDEGKPVFQDKYNQVNQVSIYSNEAHSGKQEGGHSEYDRWIKENTYDTWEAQSSSFFNAVQHLITKNIPEAYPCFKATIRSGSLNSRVDFYNGESVVEFVVASLNELNLKLTEGLGKLCLIDKMLTRSKPKMLVICTNIERPRTNPKLLDDQSTANAMGIELLYVTPHDEVIAAEAVIKFISNSSAQK